MTAALRVIVPPKAEVDGDIVDRLTHALELAKSGDLDGLCFIALHSDGSTTTAFSRRIDRLKMVGALQWTLWRMTRQFEDD